MSNSTQNRCFLSSAKHPALKTLVVVALATALIPGPASAGAAEETALASDGASIAEYTKDEDVYGVLAGNGQVESLYVVNRFNIAQRGEVIDFGLYDAVESLSDRFQITSTDGMQKLELGEGVSYYRGTIENGAIPWNLSISYTLNGEETEAKQLAGASGCAGITIGTQRNLSFPNSLFYENYMLQVSFTVPADCAKNIRLSSGGIIADAGSNKQITFTVMPEKAGDLSFQADVTDFEMGSISIAAAPFSMSMDDFDTSEMTDGMQELADGVQEIADGTAELADGACELSDGAFELADGVRELSSGADEMADGVSELADGAQGYAAGVAELAGGTSLLPDAVEQLAQGAHGIEQGLLGLNALLGYASPADSAAAVSAMDSAIASLESARAALAAAQQLDTTTEVQQTESSADAAEATTADAAPARTVTQTVTITRTADTTPLIAAIEALDVRLAELRSARNLLAGSLAPSDRQADAQQVLAGLITGTGQLASGLDQLAQQMPQLAGGMDRLAVGAQQIADGTGELAGGTAEFSSGTAELSDGTFELASGTAELADGTSELNDGMQEFAAETADLPQQMADGVNEAMAEFNREFDSESFVSKNNSHTEYVQFAFTTRPISIPDEERPAPANEMPDFFERLAALLRF